MGSNTPYYADSSVNQTRLIPTWNSVVATKATTTGIYTEVHRAKAVDAMRKLS